MKLFIPGMFLFGSVFFQAGLAEAGIALSANAAGSQASTVSGVTTENFNSFAAGTYTTLNTAVGTVTSPGAAIVVADQYGGAGGTGNYFSIGAQSGQDSALLTLSGPMAYFGLWWSASDPLNQIEFLSGGNVVASYTSATAFAGLGSAYDGNPNNGDDSGEKFAYLNFSGTNGTTFDQIKFTNTNTSTGFESDNWSVRAAAAAVPEPSSLALTATGILASLGLAGRRRASRKLA